ncbi:hypothetical protein FQA39_LY17005 [Lamprigera yunnana]|nr:hypothetical protein FQA39_LY17005 [Lamprigera yunnana]
MSFVKQIPSRNHSNLFSLIKNISRNMTEMASINTIAVCQFTATNNKQKNLDIVKKFVSYASQQNAKMIFLPEACDFIAVDDGELKNLAEPLEGPLVNQYQELAKKYQVWLSVGGFHERQIVKDEEVFYNSHLIISDQGFVTTVYRKTHLFDVYVPEKDIDLKESNTISPGMEIQPPVCTPIGTIGLMICYDLRFPELSVILRKMGANILTYPSAFTVPTGEAHWEILLRARAIENQCYVIAAAQYGLHNDKRTSFGQSLIIDPWGKIISESPKFKKESPINENIMVATIDIDLTKNVREKMPTFKHRRDDLYQLIPKVGLLEDLRENYLFSNKVIPADIVFYSTSYSYAFTNIRCVVPGHVLVAPLRCVKRLKDLSEVEIVDFFNAAVKVQKIVETVYGSDSSTVCIQDGPNAGQTVPHVHCHILPRKEGDFENNDDIYAELAKHDKSDEQCVRTFEEMKMEANILRKIC